MNIQDANYIYRSKWSWVPRLTSLRDDGLKYFRVDFPIHILGKEKKDTLRLMSQKFSIGLIQLNLSHKRSDAKTHDLVYTSRPL